MKRTTILLTIAVALMTALYHLYNQRSLMVTNAPLASVTPVLEAPPALQPHKPAKSSIANPDVWNLQPAVPLGKMLSLKDMFKPTYSLVRNGRIQVLRRSDRPNESWELQGIVMRGTQLRALLYNAGLRKMKNYAVGDMLDEQLTVKNITSGSVIIEAKDGKKPQLFELYLFNSQKDTYASKRKTL